MFLTSVYTADHLPFIIIIIFSAQGISDTEGDETRN